jgi:hypothetical protein
MDVPRGRLQHAVHVDRDRCAHPHQCDVVPVGVIEDVVDSDHLQPITVPGVEHQRLVALTDLPHGYG